MRFREVLTQVIDWLQQDKRVSYRALKREFNLDDDFIADLKEELLYAHPVVDDESRGLIWTGDTEPTSRPDQSIRQGEALESRFHATLSAIIIFLQREERATYRELRHAFGLDDGLLGDIQKALQFKQVAVDEGGEGLVWTGKAQPHVPPAGSESEQQVSQELVEFTSPADSPLSSLDTQAGTRENGLTASPERSRRTPEAENRQLTVVFCDLADSTTLSQQFDPEDLREVVRAYQETAATVIARYEGHIAQYLGDGLLIYFGWPQAHENDAERAVYTGFEIPEAIQKLNTRLDTKYGVQLSVRIGIHTGPVVVGEMGGGNRHENLALGETPNIAARLEGLAQPNTVVISPATAQLVQRSFVFEELGEHELKGVSEPMMLFSVVGIREAKYDAHVEMLSGGFDALVGRDEEIGLLLRRWEQSKNGQGQVVLISGEAGLGKSSLVEGLRSHVHQEGYTRIAFRCSPYTTNSALYPVIEHVQRALGWEREDATEIRLNKLERVLQSTSLSVEENLPLLADLLSLPVPENRYPALTLSPQRQRQLTLDALVAWMLEEAENQPMLAVWEDLHWADPSTLELLGLFIEQVPTVSMLNVLAFRPEFVPPWPTQSHMTPITLNRLERIHIDTLVRRLSGGKMLPQEVETHIVTKTDGVPLYVEELTKMLLESGLLEEDDEAYVLTGSLSDASIPATLKDSLMARLDSLPTVKEVAQLGAVLGREFDYEMLQALNAIDEPTLQRGLSQLVTHELLYQRGRIPRAKFMFRHALIRDSAYQSLLRRTRQAYHKQVAQLLETQFPDVMSTQPEVMAHHCMEGDLLEQAVGYWQRAGERAIQASAYIEAMVHLRQALAVMMELPETLARLQLELELQISLGNALRLTEGNGNLEVERIFTRAREICSQLGDSSQVFPVLRGLLIHKMIRGELGEAQELAEEVLKLANVQSEASLLMLAHHQLGSILYFRGLLSDALDHHSQALTIFNPDEHRDLSVRYGADLGVVSYNWHAWELWYLGYPQKALHHRMKACVLAEDVAHPNSHATALLWSASLYQLRREVTLAHDQAKRNMNLASEQGFTNWFARGQVVYGWALAMQGQVELGISEIHQGLSTLRTLGVKLTQAYSLALLAEAYGVGKDTKSGLKTLAEAVAVIESTDARFYESEIYRLKGQLLLQQAPANSPEAETCFQQAISIAQTQSAKSWELRAATSLARLWQSQDKHRDAYDLLLPVYNWFTEGFETADLIDAKALLVELGEGQ